MKLIKKIKLWMLVNTILIVIQLVLLVMLLNVTKKQCGVSQQVMIFSNEALTDSLNVVNYNLKEELDSIEINKNEEVIKVYNISNDSTLKYFYWALSR